ncbi:hypothetical protein Lal_00018968 [Lupinus albus]|nr:hypothetical protein Lal_00018968 [Lupinus albus]
MQLRTARSEEQHNGAQRRRSGDDDFLEDLPLYHRRSAAVRRDTSRSRSPEKWIHVIPVLVLLCFFFLWWFSFPVHVDVKDGRITSIKPIGPPLPPNDTRIDFTILAAATASSPIPLFPQNLLGEEEDETYFPPASSPNN